MSTRASTAPSLRDLAARAPTLSEEEERDCLRRIQEEDDPRAMETLCVSHLRMVLSTAKHYAVRGIPHEDLIAEGNLALIEAARRFDRTKQVRFSTYAAWWIRGLIRRYTLANRRVVGTPSTRNARKLLAHLRTAERELTARLGEPPTREQVAAHLGVAVSDIELVDGSLTQRDVSLGPQRDGPTVELPGTLRSPEEQAAMREERSLTARHIADALAALEDRERLILERRLMKPESDTLADIGKVLGLSGERVRQIEQASKRKLRHALLPLESVA